MGRRSVPLSDPSRWVFNRLAPFYAGRPPYPEALLSRLAELAGGPGARVADLGAGTGLVTLPLAARGLAVTAVEPAVEMLAALRGRAPRAGVTAVHATAEATGLPPRSVELAVIADALQWVDPELAGRELARLLAPGGVAALVEGAFARTPFMAALSALLARANPRSRPRPPGAARQLLALAAPRAAVRTEAFTQDEPLAPEALEGLLRSFSYAGPALGPDALERLLAAAHAAAGAAGGARFHRELTLRWVRRPDRA